MHHPDGSNKRRKKPKLSHIIIITKPVKDKASSSLQQDDDVAQILTVPTHGEERNLWLTSSPPEIVSSGDAPIPPNFLNDQTKNNKFPIRHPEIINSTDNGPLPPHYLEELAEGEDTKSPNIRHPEIIASNDAPMPPQYYEQSGKSKIPATRRQKRFNFVLPTHIPRHTSSETPPPQTVSSTQTTSIPFYEVEATLVRPSPIYEANIVPDERQTNETQKRRCQLILGAGIVLILCVMAAAIGALTASRNREDLPTTNGTATVATAPDMPYTTALPSSTGPSTSVSATQPSQTATQTTQSSNMEGSMLQLNIQYSISSNCGVTAQDAMHENGNTIKQGLIEATETVIVRTLNETFPSVHSSPGRRLVYYSKTHPVVITYIEDLDQSVCQPGTNCMEVMSVIYLTLEAGEDAREIEELIRSGIDLSFKDRSLFQAIPPDTVFCPEQE